MSDGEYLEALHQAIPWTAGISPEILIYAGRANCVVQVEGGSHRQALEDAAEQGFQGREGPKFIQLSAETYCPSMQALAEPESTPEPATAATPEADPASMVPELTGETVGFQDGRWEVEFNFAEVPGATAYEVQHRGTDGYSAGGSTDWASDVFDAPSAPEESLRNPGTISGLVMEHDPSTSSVNHRVRAYFDDDTVGRWSNVVTAYNPHL